METFEAITTGRSVRSFRPDPAAEEIERSLLTAAMAGPSTGDQRMGAVRDCLGSPENLTPFAVVAIGSPASPTVPVDRYQPERVHADGW